MSCISTPCSCTTTSTEGCTSTINTDCVFYKGDRLSFEDPTIIDGSSRTASSLFEKLSLTRQKFPSKIITYDIADGIITYTLTEDDLGKTLLLSGSDNGVGGTVNFYLNIPSTTAFRDEEIVIKDISTPLNPGTTAYEYNLNIAVQTNFDPVTQSQLFSVLSTNRTLVLRFIQDNLGVYRWFKIG